MHEWAFACMHAYTNMCMAWQRAMARVYYTGALAAGCSKKNMVYVYEK